MERIKQQEKQEVVATVVEALPNDLFRVELRDRSSVWVHVGARRQNDFLRLLPGDNVRIQVSPYDQRRGRITGRYES